MLIELMKVSGSHTLRNQCKMLCYVRYPFIEYGYNSNSSKNKILAFFGDTFRDCRQITFGTLNEFCLFNKFSLPKPPVLNGMSTKIKQKIQDCFTCFKDTATSSFISCCFTSAFTSVDIIFYKFLEFQSTLSEKKFLSGTSELDTK